MLIQLAGHTCIFCVCVHNYLLLLKQYSEKLGWSREQLATVYSDVFPGWQETSPERDKKFGPLLCVTGLLDKGSSDFFFLPGQLFSSLA